MILLQDILSLEVERVRKKVFVGGRCLDNIKFYYSAPDEFAAMMIELNKKMVLEKYPFFYVNSIGVKYSGDIFDRIVTIPEIIIATATKSEYLSAERDFHSIRPILLPVYENFTNDLVAGIKGAVLQKAGDITIHYFYGKKGIKGYSGTDFPDNVDAIQILNTQIRLFNNCKI
jgi:hypothetical protein